MAVKEYGVPDPDPEAYESLMAYVNGMDVKHILHHPRMPIDARPCKLPGSLRVQAVLTNDRVITAIQYRSGGVIKIETT